MEIYDRSTTTSFRLPIELLRRAKIEATRSGITMGELFNRAIEREVSEREATR
jgi:predicted DNA-binding protein